MKKPEPIIFDPPLPPELRGKENLTPKEKKADEAYRDKNFKLHGTAARLSERRRRLNHAKGGIDIYAPEVARLDNLLQTTKRFPKGKREELKNARTITAHNLAEACFHHGWIDMAITVLRSYDPKSDKIEFYEEVKKAIARPDDEHCEHPATDKRVVTEIYIPARAGWVDLIGCQCGFLNATTERPSDMLALRRAQAAHHGKGTPDSGVLAHAERLHREAGGKDAHS